MIGGIGYIQMQALKAAIKAAIKHPGEHDESVHHPGGGGGAGSSQEKQLQNATNISVEGQDMESQAENALREAKDNARATEGKEALIQGQNIDHAQRAVDHAKSAQVQAGRAERAAIDGDTGKAAEHLLNGWELLDKADIALSKIK